MNTTVRFKGLSFRVSGLTKSGIKALVGFLIAVSPCSGALRNEPAREALVSDPKGDVILDGAVPPQKDEGNNFPEADLLAVWIGPENETSVEIGVQFQVLSKNVGRVRDTQIHLENSNASFRLQILTRFGQPTRHKATLWQEDEEGYGHETASLAPVEDASTNSLVVAVPRLALPDEYAVPLRFGSRLSGFFATTKVPIPTGEAAYAGDRAPDSGFGPVFESQFLAPNSQGDLFMRAAIPVRASNGEATTLVYNLSLTNRGARDHHALFSVENRPDSWLVRTPARVSVPATRTVFVPVVLVLGSDHLHGVTRYFDVRAESQDDSTNWAVVRLGVEWLQYPQPAGHHPRLFAHSTPFETGFPGDPYERHVIWMNANSTGTDPNARDDDVSWYANGEIQSPGEFTARWRFPLQPHLRMGLSLDSNLTGSLKTQIRPGVNAQSAQVQATVVYYCGRFDSTSAGRPCADRPRILASGESPTMTFAGETEFDLPLAVPASIHRIPFMSGANIGLEIALTTEYPQSLAAGPEPHPTLVVSETSFVLPFLEYHDAIEPAFQHVGTVKVSVAGASEKEVNPGRAATFRLMLSNEGNQAAALTFVLEGSNKEWAELGQSTATIAAHSSASISLRIRVPDNAAERESADVVFIAQADDDPNVMGLARIRATVVDSSTRVIPDEAWADGERNGRTPWWSPVETILALAGVLIVSSFGRAAKVANGERPPRRGIREKRQ